MSKATLSIGEVAKICKVHVRTASGWFDSGRLRGYRIPHTQERRIPQQYLDTFMKQYGLWNDDLKQELMFEDDKAVELSCEWDDKITEFNNWLDKLDGGSANRINFQYGYWNKCSIAGMYWFLDMIKKWVELQANRDEINKVVHYLLKDVDWNSGKGTPVIQLLGNGYSIKFDPIREKRQWTALSKRGRLGDVETMGEAVQLIVKDSK